jgi:hypothetical protein
VIAAVVALARRAEAAAWFAAVGAPPTAGEDVDAARYLRALGRAEVTLGAVSDWGRAKALADSPDWDAGWWDAEERLRQALLDVAGRRHGRAVLLAALTEATQAVSDPAHGHAARSLVGAGIADAALARAAAGAATQATYLAGLAAAAEVPVEHAFHAKFRLFEAGRWPLGIVGARFWLF